MIFFKDFCFLSGHCARYVKGTKFRHRPKRPRLQVRIHIFSKLYLGAPKRRFQGRLTSYKTLHVDEIFRRAINFLASFCMCTKCKFATKVLKDCIRWSLDKTGPKLALKIAYHVKSEAKVWHFFPFFNLVWKVLILDHMHAVINLIISCKFQIISWSCEFQIDARIKLG